MNMLHTAADGQSLYRISYMMVKVGNTENKEMVIEYHWSHSLQDAMTYARKNTPKFGCDYFRMVKAC